MRKIIFNPLKEIGYKDRVRLVVYDMENKAFIRKELINGFEVLEASFEENINIENLKYKYQNIKEAKWKDITKYKFVLEDKFDIKNITSNFNFNKIDRENITYLKDMSQRQITQYAKILLRKYYYFLLASPNLTKVDRVNCYLKIIPLDIVRSNNSFAYVYALIVSITEFLEESLTFDRVSINDENFKDWWSRVTSKYKFDQEDTIGFKVGSLVAKGHISSLLDRQVTFTIYQKALKLGAGFIENFLSIDPLSTYYSEIDETNNTYEIIDSNTKNIKDNVLTEISNINVCFSTDTSYFQMYAMNWANANFYFEELIFNFGVVAHNEDDYNHCIDSYQLIIESIAKLLNAETPNNFRFFWIKSRIVNKTVYACARFYLAKHLLSKYNEDIYISDIDQLVIGDFEKYLENFSDKKYSVYQPITSGYFNILPGRSHMAGNIYIRNDNTGKKYCEILTNYVGMGLDDKFPWILDQNATRFASELIEVGNLDNYGKRTLKQYPDLKIKLKSLSK